MKNIVIKNFQSHKNSSIELHPGVNVFSGNSDCGKSAIMRAIIWAITNSPSGDAFVSHWARDKKGKQRDECSVRIDSVERQRGKDFNGYVTSESKYEALRGEVPPDVEKELNISDVNIQRQLDAPFMLSNTPGENARYINELVKLSGIDKATAWVASNLRETNSKIKSSSESIKSLESKLIPEDRVSEVSLILESLEELQDKVYHLNSEIRSLAESISLYESYRPMDIPGFGKIICELKTNIENRETIRGKYSSICNGISEYEKYSSIPNCDINVKAVERIGKMLYEMKSESETLESDMNSYCNLNKTICENNNELENIKLDMSTMRCPMCGREGCDFNHI